LVLRVKTKPATHFMTFITVYFSFILLLLIPLNTTGYYMYHPL
jgi:hypothetical protein